MARTHELTPERLDRITVAIEHGAKPHIAAEFAGVPRSTFYSWLARGEHDRQHHVRPDDYTRAELVALCRDAGVTPTARATKQQIADQYNDHHTTPFLELVERIAAARATGQMHALEQFHKAAGNDWRAWIELLKRAWPEDWGDAEQLPGPDPDGLVDPAAAIEQGAARLRLVSGGDG